MADTEFDAFVDDVAHICHEVNRAYCAATGDNSQQPWESAPNWQKESARKGVEGIAQGRIKSPEESHQSWLAQKVADGWAYGEQKDEATKTHPCMVPYAELPPAQQVKDALFFAVVLTCLRMDGHAGA